MSEGDFNLNYTARLGNEGGCLAVADTLAGSGPADS